MCQGDLISHSQRSGVRSVRRRRLLTLFDPNTLKPLSFPFRESCKAALVYTAAIPTALESVSCGRVSSETLCTCVPVKVEVKRKTAFGGFSSHSSCGDLLLRFCVFLAEGAGYRIRLLFTLKFPTHRTDSGYHMSFQCTLAYVLPCLLGLLVNFIIFGGFFNLYILFYPRISICCTISTMSEKRLLFMLRRLSFHQSTFLCEWL